jgi:hypothetical protein
LDLAELARQTAREIAEGKAVIFLGVGASVGTESEWNEGKGVLSSGELTRAIADRFGVNLQYDGGGELESTLRGIASLAVLERHPSTVKRFVIEKISPGCGKPLRVHRALARVAPTIVMTTNYDDLYEAAMQEAGKDCERIVQSSDLVGLPINRPRVLKLHGDKEQPNEIVLTGPDYMAWRKRAAGLQAEVVAALQKHVCVFVGYSVSDENLGDVLKIISENLDANAPKHFAVVHEIDKERAAELHGSVEFVEGDATRFCEMLAEESAVQSPRPRDPQRERAAFEAQLETGDLVEAGQSCENLARFLIARGENAGPRRCGAPSVRLPSLLASILPRLPPSERPGICFGSQGMRSTRNVHCRRLSASHRMRVSPPSRGRYTHSCSGFGSRRGATMRCSMIPNASSEPTAAPHHPA